MYPVGRPLPHDLAFFVHHVFIWQDPRGYRAALVVAPSLELDIVKRIQRVLNLLAQVGGHRALDASALLRRVVRHGDSGRGRPRLER